jgi:hypothetical protein
MMPGVSEKSELVPKVQFIHYLVLGDPVVFNDRFNPDTSLLYGLSDAIIKYTNDFMDYWKEDPKKDKVENAYRSAKRKAMVLRRPFAQKYTSALIGLMPPEDEFSLEYYTEALKKYPRFAELNKNKKISTSCKFLLEYAGTMTMDIFFLLDKLDVDAIASKTGSGSKSFTSIELRNIYRNRDEDWVKNHVFFIINGAGVDPPWISKKELWQEYSKRRVEKMLKSYDEGLNLIKQSSGAATSSTSASSITNNVSEKNATYIKDSLKAMEAFRNINAEDASKKESLLALYLLCLREELNTRGLLQPSAHSGKDYLHSLA